LGKAIFEFEITQFKELWRIVYNDGLPISKVHFFSLRKSLTRESEKKHCKTYNYDTHVTFRMLKTQDV